MTMKRIKDLRLHACSKNSMLLCTVILFLLCHLTAIAHTDETEGGVPPSPRALVSIPGCPFTESQALGYWNVRKSSPSGPVTDKIRVIYKKGGVHYEVEYLVDRGTFSQPQVIKQGTIRKLPGHQLFNSTVNKVYYEIKNGRLLIREYCDPDFVEYQLFPTWSANEPQERNLKGVVVDNQGTPIAGASVRVWDTQYEVNVTTNQQGQFAVANAPITCAVTASQNGYASTTVTPKEETYVRIALSRIVVANPMEGPGGDPRPRTSVRDERHNVRGLVVNPNDEPIIGAAIKLLSNSEKGTVTGFDGTFTLTDVPSGSFILVTCPKYTDKTVQLGNKTYVKVVLQPKEGTEQSPTEQPERQQGGTSSPQQPGRSNAEQTCISNHLAFMGISMGESITSMQRRLHDKGFTDTENLLDAITLKGQYYGNPVIVGLGQDGNHTRTVRVIDKNTSYKPAEAQKRFNALLRELKAIYGEGKMITKETWEWRYDIKLSCGTVILQMFDSDEMDASSGVYTIGVTYDDSLR